MTFDYIPKGVCARKFTIQVEDGVIQSVKAEGGCNGNLQGVAALLRGMTPEEAVQRMEGIRCGRSAQAVGLATTTAVVQSIVGIIIATAVITIICNVLGI